MPLTPAQGGWLELAFIICLAGFVILYALGLLDWIPRALGIGQNRDRMTYRDYDWPPNFPRPQIMVEGRALDYGKYREQVTDPMKGISKGTLYLYVDDAMMPYATNFDPATMLQCNVIRTLKEKRLYFDLVTAQGQTSKDIALTLARNDAKTAWRQLNVVLNYIRMHDKTEQGRRLFEKMARGARRTGETITGGGEGIQPPQDKGKGDIPPPQPSGGEGEGEDQGNEAS